MLASALSLVLRYRRSGGEVRQQIKWIVFAASLMGLLYLAVLENVMLLSFAGVPVALGFAVLKYRLYAIDIFSTAPSSTACSQRRSQESTSAA
jgi:two-component system NarL family sensor kinase